MRYIFLIPLFALLVAGCATYTAYDVKVDENNISLYVQDQLSKQIKIDNSLTYKGASSLVVDGMRGKKFQFYDEISGKSYIEIHVFNSFGEFEKVNLKKDRLEHGIIEIGHRSYFYAIHKLLHRNKCTLMKVIQVPVQADLKILVLYLESLATGPDCDNWSDPLDLNEAQKEYLMGFNSRSSEYIEILN